MTINVRKFEKTKFDFKKIGKIHEVKMFKTTSLPLKPMRAE